MKSKLSEILIEFVSRFLSKSPKFMVWLQIIFAVLTGASLIVTNLVNTGTITETNWVINFFTGDDSWIKWVIGIIVAQFAMRNDEAIKLFNKFKK